jgi:ParB/RepB/Spo0J family partition protein
MRADKHYVDQLTEPSVVSQPIRMLQLDQVDDEPAVHEVDLRPLIESIRTHGIIHPLLVRASDGRFRVVAGRRRFAAARILRLAALPCVVHDLDDEQAAALAAADNLTLSSRAPVDPSQLSSAIAREIAHHVETIQSCTGMMVARNTALARSVIDLIAAHAWRVARLIDAVDFVTGNTLRSSRRHALSTIVDEVIDGFAPESRLNGFTLQAQVADGLSSSGLNDREIFVGLSAALLAALAFAEDAVQPTILIRAQAADHGSLAIEIVQPEVSVSPRTARQFFDDSVEMRPGGCTTTVGMLAAKALAERYGGTATLDAAPQGGNTLRLTLVRRS